AEAAGILASAHKQGHLHRDIKPSNLMLDHLGAVRLLDFGLTRSLTTSGESSLGLILGTPWYMSPEQASGEIVDERTDIYSLDLHLYELGTARPPPSPPTPPPP